MRRWWISVAAALALAGCAATEEGTGGPTATGVGALTGAALGAVVGSAAGGPDGTWIGALTGAAVGTAAGAAYAENEKDRNVPWASRGGPRGSQIYSPHSNAIINDPGYARGKVIYDPNTGEPFRVP